jgi:tripartite-type tricarboxylate transporter receptor subunit TctC
VVQKLNAAVQKIVAKPDVQQQWAKQGVFPLNQSQAEFEKFLRGDIEKWAKIVKASGLAVQ